MDITTDQFCDVTLVITTASGQPAQVQGVPAWASSDETVVTMTPNADGMGGRLNTVAPKDVPQRITVTADADLGAGVITITGVSEDINVSQGASGRASVMTLTLGAPVAKP